MPASSRRWENVADYEHPYVGRTFTYLPGLESQEDEPREKNLVVRAGDKVRVVAAFRKWNGFDGNDILYVRNLSSTSDITHTHIAPGELGIPALNIASMFDLFAESRIYGKVPQSRKE